MLSISLLFTHLPSILLSLSWCFYVGYEVFNPRSMSVCFFKFVISVFSITPSHIKISGKIKKVFVFYLTCEQYENDQFTQQKVSSFHEIYMKISANVNITYSSLTLFSFVSDLPELKQIRPCCTSIGLVSTFLCPLELS